MFSLGSKIMGGALAACAAFIIGLWVTNAHLRAELAEMRADNAAFVAANDQCKAGIEHQNAAIAKMQAEAEARHQAAIKAARDAQAVAWGFESEAEKLRQKTASGDLCAAADNLINDYLRRVK